MHVWKSEAERVNRLAALHRATARRKELPPESLQTSVARMEDDGPKPAAAPARPGRAVRSFAVRAPADALARDPEIGGES